MRVKLSSEEWAVNFWARVDKEGPIPGFSAYGDIGNCWMWTAATDSHGYGAVGRDGKVLKAHRVAAMAAGLDLDDGQVVMHLCDNPGCVNPDHLRASTQRANMRDAVSKKRNAHGETSYAKLSEHEVLQIRARYSDGSCTQAQLGLEFGVHQVTISKIVSRKRWTHLP